MIGFQSIGHFFASAFHEVAVGARAVEKVAAVLPKSEMTVEAITSLAFPQFVPLERLAYAALGHYAAAVTTADNAVAAGGTNVVLDAELTMEIKQFIAEWPGLLAQAKAAVPTKA